MVKACEDSGGGWQWQMEGGYVAGGCILPQEQTEEPEAEEETL